MGTVGLSNMDISYDGVDAGDVQFALPFLG